MRGLDGVARTCEDAARGKLAAVQGGYYKDDFLRSFTSPLPRSPGPLINRGHYLRVAALDTICARFLCSAGLERAQIVSLGAGLDTRFWQLDALGMRARRFIEVDQPDVVARKCAAVSSQHTLLSALPEGVDGLGPSGIHSPASGYTLIAADLCDVAQLASALSAGGWEPMCPTLLIAECVEPQP